MTKSLGILMHIGARTMSALLHEETLPVSIVCIIVICLGQTY